MAANGGISSSSDRTTSSLRNRIWRYAPLIIWMTIIFVGSTDALSASNSGLILKPILFWLFPHISEPQIATIHFCLRKLAHFSEYAILAILAARAFYGSGHERLRQEWFAAALLLIFFYAFGDEFHQSFEVSRTASIYDSFIDIAGGVTALLLIAMWRQRRRQKAAVS